MAELRTYQEGTPFTGAIGKTASESTAAWPVPPRAREGAPNVVFILLDDVGSAQLGCFGADIRTPTFDRLAAGGLPVTDQYRAPFRFTGTIKRMVVEVDGPGHDDPEAALRATFGTQ